MSSFGIAKCYTKQLVDYLAPESVSHKFGRYRDILIEKRNLNLIMRLKSAADLQIEPGNLVQVYIKTGHEKRGKWSTPRIENMVDMSAGTVFVPGSNGKKIIAALEDTRVAIVEDYIASYVLESIDQLDDGIEESLNYPSDYTTDTALDDSGTSKHSSALNSTFDGIKSDCNM